MATLDAQFCSPEERVLSAKPNPRLHCLTRNESIALAVCTEHIKLVSCDLTFLSIQFLTQSGALSLFACVVTFALILVSSFTTYDSNYIIRPYRGISTTMRRGCQADGV